MLVYPHRQDLCEKLFFICSSCWAFVGVHKDSGRPLGRLANAELRRLKRAAHAAFDPLWQRKMQRDHCSKKSARGAAYMWLADQMKIPREDCHIGMFDEAQCRAATAICSNLKVRG